MSDPGVGKSSQLEIPVGWMNGTSARASTAATVQRMGVRTHAVKRGTEGNEVRSLRPEFKPSRGYPVYCQRSSF